MNTHKKTAAIGHDCNDSNKLSLLEKQDNTNRIAAYFLAAIQSNIALIGVAL